MWPCLWPLCIFPQVTFFPFVQTEVLAKDEKDDKAGEGEGF